MNINIYICFSFSSKWKQSQFKCINHYTTEPNRTTAWETKWIVECQNFNWIAQRIVQLLLSLPFYSILEPKSVRHMKQVWVYWFWIQWCRCWYFGFSCTQMRRHSYDVSSCFSCVFVCVCLILCVSLSLCAVIYVHFDCAHIKSICCFRGKYCFCMRACIYFYHMLSGSRMSGSACLAICCYFSRTVGVWVNFLFHFHNVVKLTLWLLFDQFVCI